MLYKYRSANKDFTKYHKNRKAIEVNNKNFYQLHKSSQL